MFDAGLANRSSPGSSHGARQHSLFASLKHVFWRAPRWYEPLIYAWLPVGFWLEHGFSVGVLTRFVAMFLIIRSMDVPVHYYENRWPDSERRLEYGVRGAVGLAMFYASLPIFFKLWQDGARNGIDWATTGSNVLSAFAFGVFILVLLGPLMWLLDRVFRPMFQSKSEKFVGALGFLALCGAWWLIIIFGSIHLGLAQFIWGNSPSW